MYLCEFEITVFRVSSIIINFELCHYSNNATNFTFEMENNLEQISSSVVQIDFLSKVGVFDSRKKLILNNNRFQFCWTNDIMIGDMFE